MTDKDNNITVRGMRVPRDSDTIADKINDTLTRKGCTAHSFLFLVKRFAPHNSEAGDVVVKRQMADGVYVSVSIEGNKGVTGILSPADGNLMTPEGMLKYLPEKPKRKNKGGGKAEKQSKKGLIAGTREDFVGFLLEFLGNAVKPQPAHTIATAFNESGKGETSGAKCGPLLSEFVEQGIIRRVTAKPYGMYSLPVGGQATAPQQTSVSVAPSSSEISGTDILGLCRDLEIAEEGRERAEEEVLRFKSVIEDLKQRIRATPGIEKLRIVLDEVVPR